jgi:probable HAF family extracellular repeat protein
MNVRYRLATMFVAAILTTAPGSASAQTPRTYRVDDLGSFGGPDLVGLAINNNGEIAGYGYLPDGTIHAFRWTESAGLEDLGVNGGWLSQAIGINDNGDVVGVYLDAASQPHGFVAPRGGVMRDLRTPDRQIVRVNSITSDGRMTGMLYSFTPSFQAHAFRTLSDGTLEDLGDTVYASVGWHINDAGEVSGYEARSPTGTEQSAFRFSDALGKVDLGVLGGARSSGMSINNSGVVVGWSEGAAGSWSRAFRARPGFPIEDLGTLGGIYAGADAINDAEQVVGWSTGQAFMTAFVYSDADGMIDLNTRIAPIEGGHVMSEALGINNAGQIVVLYDTGAGTGTRRLTPIVETGLPRGTALTTNTQAMNGDMKVAQGSTLSAGYDFTMPGTHPSATVGFLGAQVTFQATCASGTPGSMTITVNIPDQSYVDPPSSPAWYPSSNQNSSLTYQGSATVPSFCDAGALVRFQQGGTFSTHVTSTDISDKVNIRWHYMDGTGGGWSGMYSITPSN